ncbi:MAG: SPASM domain-containing protein [Elusimicrobia bacterium]|nr:SPASM domain-containing protein [Elusimicrobiota bacterium]
MQLCLSVELTDVCNARCNYCVIGTGRPPHGDVQLGFLSVEDFRKLADGLDGFLHDPFSTPSSNLDLVLRYCGIGEPTLHKDFLEFLRIGFAQPLVKRVSVVTNGSFLPPARTNAMVEVIRQRPEVTTEILLGLDGVAPGPQRLVKGIDNIDKIHADLDHFLELKIRDSLRHLVFVFQLVVTDENRDHVRAFRDYWERVLRAKGLSYEIVGDWSYLDRLDQIDAFIWIKRRDSDDARQPHFDAIHQAALAEIGLVRPNPSSVHGVPTNVLQRHEQADQEDPRGIKVCGLFWYGINVNAAGAVSPCCIDNEFALEIGNVKQASLQEIYQGEAMQRLRLAHIKGDFRDIPLCQQCTAIYKYKFVPRADVETYLSALSEAEGKPYRLQTRTQDPEQTCHDQTETGHEVGQRCTARRSDQQIFANAHMGAQDQAVNQIQAQEPSLGQTSSETQHTLHALRFELEQAKRDGAEKEHELALLHRSLTQAQDHVRMLEGRVATYTCELERVRCDWERARQGLYNVEHSTAHRVLVRPLWAVLGVLRRPVPAVVHWPRRRILVVKPCHVSAADARQALTELHARWPHARLTFLANVFPEERARLERLSGVEARWLYGPGVHPLTGWRLLSLLLHAQLQGFAEGVLLVGPPVPGAYWKGNLLLSVVTPAVSYYHVGTDELVSHVETHPPQRPDALRSLMYYGASWATFGAPVFDGLLLLSRPFWCRKRLQRPR